MVPLKLKLSLYKTLLYVGTYHFNKDENFSNKTPQTDRQKAHCLGWMKRKKKRLPAMCIDEQQLFSHLLLMANFAMQNLLLSSKPRDHLRFQYALKH